MAHQHDADQLPPTVAGRGAGRLIEKGWTVYDALEHPLGTVTDVDSSRDVLEVDGRPAGFGSFEIPLDFVGQSGGNEIHLTKAIEESGPSPDGAPRLVDPQTAASASGATQTRGRTRTTSATDTTMVSDAGPSASATPSESVTPSASAGRATTTTRPVGEADPSPTHSFGQFSPPYAAPTRDVGYGTQTPDWGTDDSGGWSAKKMGMAALALGGLAAAGYLMRRRARRKTPYERFMQGASGYLELTSDFAADASKLAANFASEYGPQRYPAWWGGLATAALPLAYYAWPSSQPTYREQATAQADTLSSTLEGYLHSLANRMPGLADSARETSGKAWGRIPSPNDFDMPFDWRREANRWMPSGWNRSAGWSMPGDWSVKPDVALPLAFVAASAVALYLARRRPTVSRPDARIRDVMTRKPRVIQPDATVADAATLMRSLDVGALPVCDGSRLIGMVTDRDITTRATAEGRDPYLTPVRDVMSPGVAWASEDDPVEEAARIMREHQIRRLPIVDERHSLVGVVSLGDLATEVADDKMSGDTLERISE
jgi:CBS domain-containing protein